MPEEVEDKGTECKGKTDSFSIAICLLALSNNAFKMSSHTSLSPSVRGIKLEGDKG